MPEGSAQRRLLVCLPTGEADIVQRIAGSFHGLVEQYVWPEVLRQNLNWDRADFFMGEA
jgi:hypothetical protein